MRAWINLNYDLSTDGPILLNDDDMRKIIGQDTLCFKGVVYTKPTNQREIDNIQFSSGDLVIYHYIKDDENKSECNELYLYFGSHWLLVEPTNETLINTLKNN